MNEIVNWIKEIDVHTLINIVEAIIIILIFNIFSSLFSIIILKIFHIKKSKLEIKQTAYYKTLKRFFKILGVYIAIMAFNINPQIFEVITKIFKIIVIILIANGISIFVGTNRSIIKGLQEKTGYNDNGKIENFIIKILKTIIYAIAIFIIIKELGYDLSGLIAGLGLRKCGDSISSTRLS